MDPWAPPGRQRQRHQQPARSPSFCEVSTLLQCHPRLRRCMNACAGRTLICCRGFTHIDQLQVTTGFGVASAVTGCSSGNEVKSSAEADSFCRSHRGGRPQVGPSQRAEPAANGCGISSTGRWRRRQQQQHAWAGR